MGGEDGTTAIVPIDKPPIPTTALIKHFGLFFSSAVHGTAEAGAPDRRRLRPSMVMQFCSPTTDLEVYFLKMKPPDTELTII